jgi:hypothetical protein
MPSPVGEGGPPLAVDEEFVLSLEHLIRHASRATFSYWRRLGKAGENKHFFAFGGV